MLYASAYAAGTKVPASEFSDLPISWILSL